MQTGVNGTACYTTWAIEILPYIEILRDEIKIPIIYISHSVEEVMRLAGDVVHIDSGKIVAQGPPQSIQTLRLNH